MTNEAIEEDANFSNDLKLLVSEWNVGSRSIKDVEDDLENGFDKPGLLGLQRLAPFMRLFGEMIENEVDIATFWTVSAGTGGANLYVRDGVSTDLTTTGYLFRMVSQALKGTKLDTASEDYHLESASGTHHGYRLVFEGDDKTIIYFVSGIDEDLNVTADLKSLINGNSHVHATRLGVVPRTDPKDRFAEGQLTHLTESDLDGNGDEILTFVLDSYELIQVVVTDTSNGQGVKIRGDDQNGTHDDVVGTINSDTLIGNDGDDTLLGKDGSDLIQGGEGNDTVDSGAEHDTVSGNSGNDSITGQTGRDVLNGNAGVDTVEGGNWHDTISGGSGADLLRGGDGDDVIEGGDGGDTLEGGAGADALSGNNGNDQLQGNGGNDTLKGEAGNDVLRGGSGDDRLLGADEDDTLWGGMDADSLDGGLGADLLSGEDRDDSLQGNGGEDTLNGGAGKDELRGGGDEDVLSGADGSDTILSGIGDDSAEGGLGADSLSGEDGKDTLQGNSGQDTLNGGKGDDELRGGSGSDAILGDGGSDTLIGGLGDDLLDGGGGSDVFAFNEDHGDDTITGFDALDGAEDIDLSGIVLIANFADLSPRMTQSGGNVVIDTGASSVTLLNVTLSDLNADDFVF